MSFLFWVFFYSAIDEPEINVDTNHEAQIIVTWVEESLGFNFISFTIWRLTRLSKCRSLAGSADQPENGVQTQQKAEWPSQGWS